MTHQPDNIFAGTQIVSLIEVRGTNNSLVMTWPDRNRWLVLLQAAGATRVGFAWYERLVEAYAEPQRHYHNQQHLAECLTEFDRARELAPQAVAVELALWFHDAVYDPKAGDNEERSAAMAAQCLEECTVNGPLVSAVAALVMVTKQHEVGANQDAGLLRDVDLSILGRDQCRFAEYEEQIRREYAWVPEVVFSSKRAAVLQRFLEHDRIFATDFFRDRYEQQARRNLEGSIARLRGLAA